MSVLPGAADVRIFGERKISMRIDVDRDRLAGYRLDGRRTSRARCSRQNVELPSGRIESQRREFTITAATDVQSTQQFEDLIVTTAANGYPVRLRDVAAVKVGAVDERVIAALQRPAGDQHRHHPPGDRQSARARRRRCAPRS